jgi:protein involved in polysaccharide export with SLBB domain
MHRARHVFRFCCFAAALSAAAMASWAQTTQRGERDMNSVEMQSGGARTTDGTGGVTGPVRLRGQGATPTTARERSARERGVLLGSEGRPLRQTLPMYIPGEFEQFVQRQAGPEIEIRRFGSELMTPHTDHPQQDQQLGDVAEFAPLVPADYLIKSGDEIVVTLWGSVDADLRLVVDRTGRIALPRVGPVLVGGVRYADLPAVISQRVGQVFRNFQVSTSLGQLRGQRVYVTGFVARPGTYTVSSLATAIQALLQAGGPTAGGSFRQIDVRRGKDKVATLDLYDILMRGDRGGDLVLQAEDVVHVNATGPQVALIGSVNRPAVFELRPGETAVDVLAMAGGFSAVADTSRLAIERLDDRSSMRIQQIALPGQARTALAQGDLLRAFSAVDAALPVQRQNKRVRVEGEVARPGEYVLPPSSTIADALAAAGGMTPAAYTFGTEFTRESVRLTQQENYDRALRDLETDLARASATQRSTTGDEAAAQAGRDASNARLLASLRTLRPSGRIILQLPPDGRELPSLMLEDGDRLRVPARPTSVGVFGSVFNGGSYLYSDGRPLDDYLALAGGPTRGADASSTFVIRANGSVISRQQRANWVGVGSNFGSVRAEPGDTIFVPEELDKTTFVQAAKDWTQILYQFGLGIAGIVSASR